MPCVCRSPPSHDWNLADWTIFQSWLFCGHLGTTPPLFQLICGLVFAFEETRGGACLLVRDGAVQFNNMNLVIPLISPQPLFEWMGCLEYADDDRQTIPHVQVCVSMCRQNATPSI